MKQTEASNMSASFDGRCLFAIAANKASEQQGQNRFSRQDGQSEKQSQRPVEKSVETKWGKLYFSRTEVERC